MMDRPLNKAELIEAVAEDAELSRVKAVEAVEAVFKVIEAALARGQEVRLTGFGTFVTAKRKAAKGRNPRTGEPMDIAASSSVRFKPGKALKDAVS